MCTHGYQFAIIFLDNPRLYIVFSIMNQSKHQNYTRYGVKNIILAWTIGKVEWKLGYQD